MVYWNLQCRQPAKLSVSCGFALFYLSILWAFEWQTDTNHGNFKEFYNSVRLINFFRIASSNAGGCTAWALVACILAIMPRGLLPYNLSPVTAANYVA